MKALLSQLCTLFLVSIVTLGLLTAQPLPPFQPEQDCINAIPVCQGTYVQPNSYQGEGLIPNEINSGPSCLGTGEENDVWYIFTVSVSGLLNFSVTPVNLGDDYDWAVYNLTNNSCGDIFGTPSLEISCNYSAAPGVTGANGMFGNQNEPPINVVAGQTFVLNVSNFSGTGTGYTLDFTQSTATIFDATPPQMDALTFDCSGSLSLSFSENVVCSTVDISDFTITNLAGTQTYTINSVTGAACAGGTFEDEFQFTITPPFVSGDYIISVVDVVQDNCGNNALLESDTFTVVVPNISLSVSNSDSICVGQNVTISTPAQPGITYVWNPGAIPGNSITVSPTTTTNYTLTATDPAGCIFTGDTLITVIPTPVSSFSAVPIQVCPDEVVSLTFTGSALPSANYTWDFDGATTISGSGAGPYQVSWPNPGLMNLTLDIDQFGCASTQTLVPVTVNPLPIASFVAQPDVCVGSSASFSYAGNATPAATYTWDFDGGFVSSGTGQGPYTVDWVIPGPKDVCLIVQENGCTSTVFCQQIMVNPLPVITIAEPINQCLKGNEFSFSYTGTNTPSNYQWDLGELGASSTLVNPVYSYTTSGPKVVTLTITDENGCINTGSRNLEVYPSPEADFSYQPVCFGDRTPFTDQTQVDGTGPIQFWQWTFDTQGGAVDQNPSFTFNQYGTHPVRLEVISIHGCRDTANQDITVYDEPIAEFAFKEVCENESVNFINGSLFNNPNVTYSWDFGDTETDNTANPVHLYQGFGVFLANMTITTDEGCTDSYQASVEVFPLPTADFVADSVCHETATSLTNTSSVPAPGELSAFQWTLSDGTVSVEENPRLEYPDPGKYPTEIRVITQHGCADSLTKEILIYPNPITSFFSIPACETDSILFRNESRIIDSVSADYIESWRWDFGDGNRVENLPNPGHLYFSDGRYDATLTAISDKGCEVAFTRQVTVWPNPEAPEIMEDTVCFGSQAFLLAYRPDTTIKIHWYYDLNDEDYFQENVTFPTPPVTSQQTYYVESFSDQGCTSTRIPIEASVYEALNPAITMSATVVEIPQAIVELAVDGVPNAEKYSWNLGDGATASTETLVHEYEHPGIYEIAVNIVSEQGCELSLKEMIEVKQVMGVHLPTAFSPNGDGRNDEYFIGSSLMRQIHFEVYDRWGKMIYTTDQADFKWDGTTLKGELARTGVYVFHLKGVDYQGNDVDETGTLTLIR